MNTGQPPFGGTPQGYSGGLPGSGRANFGQAAASGMSMQWSALHDAARIIATLAGVAPEPTRPELRNFPAIVRDAGGWRKTMAEQGVSDLSAIIETGLAALLSVNARGVDPRAAALSLWHEFLSARAALLELAPQAEAMRRAF